MNDPHRDALPPITTTRQIPRRSIRHRRGSATVEGLLIFIIFLAISFGFFFFSQSSLSAYFRNGNYCTASPLL